MPLGYSTPAVTPLEAQAYVDGRALAGWPSTLPAQTAALRRGQDYIARGFNHRWLIEFTDATAPELVKFAIVEAALVEAGKPGVLSPTVTAASAKVLTEVNGIKWERIPITSGASTAATAMTPILTHVEAMLFQLARPRLFPAALVV